MSDDFYRTDPRLLAIAQQQILDRLRHTLAQNEKDRAWRALKRAEARREAFDEQWAGPGDTRRSDGSILRANGEEITPLKPPVVVRSQQAIDKQAITTDVVERTQRWRAG